MLKTKALLKLFAVCLCIFLVNPFCFNVFAADDASASAADSSAAGAVNVTQPVLEEIHSLTRESPTNTPQHVLDKEVRLESAGKGAKQNSLFPAAEIESATATTPSSISYTGVIPNEGESAYLYPIFVQSGDALQVQLDCPLSQQLDYDLYLYEFDMSTGDLITTPIDYSIYGTYFNGGKTISENVGSINTASYEKAYFVQIYAKIGGSINEEFTLTVSTSTDYDQFETDENAFHAYGFTVSTGGSSLSARSISTTIDNDWYYINVPSSRNYDAINFSLDASSVDNGCAVEVYSVAEGNLMQMLSPSSNGNVSLSTGTYYFRVYTTEDYSASNYTLTLKPVLRPGKIIITGYNSNGGPNDYPNYYLGTHYRITGRTFTITGVVATSDDYAVANTNVTALWENPFWSEASGLGEVSGTAYTNDSGQFTITLNLPPSTGSLSQYLPGPISFTHYFDICSVRVSVTNNPSIYDTDSVYHYAYSMYEG